MRQLRPQARRLSLLPVLLFCGALSSMSAPRTSAAPSTCNAAAAGACESVTTATLALNDGRSIPVVGLGVYQSRPGDETYNAVLSALSQGYRHIDTAHLYRNEIDVGRAVRDSGIPRDEIFITTKLWAGFNGEPEDGYEHAIASGLASQQKLGTHIDLYLIHSPAWQNERINAWRGMEELQRRGVAKSIGVSNYGVHHLEELIGDPRTEVVPAVNQIELHPFLRHDDIVEACRERWNIVIEAYSPLAKARRFGDVPVRSVVADRQEKTSLPSPAQVMLRWGLQHGFVVLPKSVNPKRIAENADLFGWELSSTAMGELDTLGEGFSTGWDPTVWD